MKQINDNLYQELTLLLLKIEPIDNIIKIDFLNKLSPLEKIVFLQDKLKELEIEEQKMNLKTFQIIKQADLALSK